MTDNTESVVDSTDDKELSHLLEQAASLKIPRVTSPASSEDSLSKKRTDSGCSYEDPKSKTSVGSGHSTDSGHGGSTEVDEGMRYAYHFRIPSHLCGMSFY